MPAFDSLSGKAAANRRWAFEDNPEGATAPARAGFLAKFEREVDPDELLPLPERRIRAERLLRAHMADLAAKRRNKRRRR